MAEFLRKYATATHVYIPMIKRAVVDFAVGADWTPAAGDVKVSIDGGAVANVATLPVAIASGNGAFWDFALSSGETTGKKISVITVDAATKAVEDQMFDVLTYGNASAELVPDYSAALATPTNITAGTITTVTNLTNAATSGDLTATMKASLATAVWTDTTAGDFTTALSVGKSVMNGVSLGTGLRIALADTVTTLTNLPSIPANWLTAAGIAAAALNGKGDWNTITPPTTAAIATGVWQDAVAGDFTAANSVGKSVMNGVALGTGLTVNALTTNNDKTGYTASTVTDKTGYALTAGERNSVADALLDRDMSVGTDSGSSTVRTMRNALRFLRNKWSISGTTLTVTKEDDTATAWTSALVATPGANPITSSDPV